MTAAAALATARRVVIGALGAWLALFATAPLGPSVSPDSAIYLSVADNLRHGAGFTQFDDQPMTRWAPLYPALLALGASALGGDDTPQAARAINAIAWGISLVLLTGWLERRVRSRLVKAVAAFLLVIAPMLLQCVAFVWSETIYLALALIVLRACEARLAGGDAAHRGLWLVALGIAAGASVMTRYAGIALLPVGLVALVLAPAGTAKGPPRAMRRAGEIALYGALALVPLALWLAHNAAVSGHLLGEGWGAHANFVRNAAILIHIVSLWWFWPSAGLALRLVFVGVVACALALALQRLARRGVFADAGARAAVVPHVAFVVSSVAVLLLWASVSGIETISDRYAAPLFPSAVLIAAWALDRLTAERTGRGLAAVLVLAFALLAGHSAVRTVQLVKLYRGPGEWGYRTKNWESSGTLAAIDRIVPPGALVYSSAPDAIYARLRRPARLLPVTDSVAGEERAERELTAARASIAREGGAWIAEFDAMQRTMLVAPETLAGACPVDTVTRTSDGMILWVRCSGAPVAPQ